MKKSDLPTRISQAPENSSVIMFRQIFSVDIV